MNKDVRHDWQIGPWRLTYLPTHTFGLPFTDWQIPFRPWTFGGSPQRGYGMAGSPVGAVWQYGEIQVSRAWWKIRGRLRAEDRE